ncbi:MAG: TerB family tellurite resistance protein [Candidatus Krumholzibacteria bacterium]|nr:TerB family tellurite resistance protein [Candidatus Krumholzibacteria bacterium]
MLDRFKKAFETGDAGAPARDAGDIRIAAAALFLEIASIDNEFSDEERLRILAILQSEYQLSPEDALALAEEARSELAGSVDLWRFTNRINESYSDEEKVRIVDLLWEIVYADGTVDAHEDYLMHKLGKLLRMPHRQLIAAKLQVLNRKNK